MRYGETASTVPASPPENFRGSPWRTPTSYAILCKGLRNQLSVASDETYAASNNPAAPMPPPIHIVTIP